jgi:hypothetical protein
MFLPPQHLPCYLVRVCADFVSLVVLPPTVTTSSAGRATPCKRPWTTTATPTLPAPRLASLSSSPLSTTLARRSNKLPRRSMAVSFLTSSPYCGIALIRHFRAQGDASRRDGCQGLDSCRLASITGCRLSDWALSSFDVERLLSAVVWLAFI